ncbi:MAG: electron transfer flavoprotein subunit alpha/FixB family protein [Candidatus Methylomirabilia bacterium]
MSVWVVAEPAEEGIHEASLEALREARSLGRPAGGGPTTVILGGAAPERALTLLEAHGADRILCLEDEALAEWHPERHAVALVAALAAERPRVVFLAHTVWGRLVAPRLAVALDAGCATDCVAVRARPDGAIEATRPTFAGRLYATVVFPPGHSTVITVRPGAIGLDRPRIGRRASVERRGATVSSAEPRSRRRRLIAADPHQVDLREAERIVAGGRGVGAPEGFAVLRELADLLGAAVGGSRVPVDLGWLPWERQIGQSGRSVSPRLYLACGISGASQHLAGIREAGTVIAINTDRTAPIFSVADLGVVGDWRAVVTALVERLRARQGS